MQKKCLECDQPATVRGYCKKHYYWARNKGIIAVVQPRHSARTSAIRDGLGRKRCGQCEVWKAEDEFPPSIASFDTLHTYCTKCFSRYKVLAQYGLTIARFDQMLLDQGNQCPICQRPFTEELKPVVDHDHTCCPYGRGCASCVRGLLCRECNILLGVAHEDIDTLARAALYLGGRDSDQVTVDCGSSMRNY